MSTNERQATRDDLHKAVDALIQRQRLRLVRDDNDKPEWHVIPSLWEQLAASTSWSGGGGAVGGAFGSRPVVSTGALALEAEIKMFIENGLRKHVKGNGPTEKYALACKAADEAWRLVEMRKAEYDMVLSYDIGAALAEIETIETCIEGSNPQAAMDAAAAEYAAELADCQAEWDAATQHWAGLNDRAENKLRTLTPDNIRALAANLTDPLDFAWWREVILDWCSQITEQLALNPVRPQYLGDVECPDCHAGTVSQKRRENGKVERVKVPALTITWASPEHDGASYQPPEKWVVQEIRCQQCSQRWRRGPELDSLVDLVIRKRGLKDKLLNKLAGLESA